MYQRQPDVSDENIGIRAFKVKRAKAVERAIERLRAGLGPSWKDLTDEEIEEVEWMFGELWAYVTRPHWEAMRFGHMSMGDVVRILTYGSQLRRHARPSTEILEDAAKVVDTDQPAG